MEPAPALGVAVAVDAGQCAAALHHLTVADTTGEPGRGERHDLGCRQQLALPRQLRERVERRAVVGEAEVPAGASQDAAADEHVRGVEPSARPRRRRPEAPGARLAVTGEHRHPAVGVRLAVGGSHDLVMEPVPVARGCVGEGRIPDLEPVLLAPPPRRAQGQRPISLHMRT